MKVEVQTLDSCRRLLQIEIPAEDVRPNYERIVREFVRSANIPGFRKGKAPRNIVERRYAGSIDEEFHQATISQAYRNAVKAQGLSIVSVVSVENVKLGLAAGLSCDVTVDVTPEFELPEYKGIPVKYELAAVTEEDVEQQLANVRQQMAEYKEVEADHELTDGDMCLTSIENLDVETEAAGEGKKPTEPNVSIVVLSDDSPETIPGIKEALKGAKEEERREFAAEYPADYHDETLAGKTVRYAVTPTLARKIILREIGDELAKATGHDTLDALKETLRKNLEQRAKAEADSKRRNATLEYMLKNTEFELPKSQSDWEFKSALTDLVRELQSRQAPPNYMEEHREELTRIARQRAETRVRSRYILSRIADLEEIDASQSEVNMRISQMAQSRNAEFDKVYEEVEREYGLDAIVNEIRCLKALDLLAEQSKEV